LEHIIWYSSTKKTTDSEHFFCVLHQEQDDIQSRNVWHITLTNNGISSGADRVGHGWAPPNHLPFFGKTDFFYSDRQNITFSP
jgi:hypothetical protein